MTKFLLHLFAGEEDTKNNSDYRSKVGKLSGFVGIGCNAVLCVMKMIVGAISGSLSITADAMNNLSDAASSIVTMVGFRLSEIPADEKHPYGHARFEYLSGLAVAAMILVIGVDIFKTSVGKIIHPVSIEFSPYVALILIVSILVKLWLSAFNKTLGNKINSSALLATALDSRNDTISTGAVLIAAIVEHVSGYRIDGYVGLAVAVFILYSAVVMGMETISPLLGEASNPELQGNISDMLKGCPQVLGIHDMMLHDYGPNMCFASVHVEMDSRIDNLESHEIIDDLERVCREKFHVILTIHYDPVVVGDPLMDKTKQEILDLLHKKDERITIHDFRMVKGENHTNIIFDAVLPVDLWSQTDEIKDYIETNMSNLGRGKFYAVITFDSSFFN